MEPRNRGALLLVIAALLWSTGGVLIKWLPLSPLTIAGTRSAIAALVILLWIRTPKPTWSVMQIGAIVSYAATVVLFVIATKMTTAANAILLQYTAPIWVALASVAITRERLRTSDWMAVIVVMCGMSVFFLEKVAFDSIVGNAIAVLSGVAFAGVALFIRAQRGVSTAESILFGNVLAALICLPFIEPYAPTPGIIGALLAMGVLQLGVSYILYTKALVHVTAIQAVMFTTLEPLLNPVWVALTVGEVPSQLSIVGGVLVVGGVIASQLRPPKPST
ncbi:MAG: DMT family transporter [bacterium]|nr:DMT family transporter [bacterium]